MATTSGSVITLSATDTQFTATGSTSYTIYGNDLDNTIIGNNAANKIFGGIGNDKLQGNDGNDSIWGGDGNDTLVGGLGADSMSGEYGNDIFYVDNTGDVIVEKANYGTDLAYSSINYTLPAYVEFLTMLGTDNLEGAGNSLANRITGNAGNNVLTGDDGNDTIYGGVGEDTLWGGNGNDLLFGQSNQNEIHGGAGDDIYYVDTGALDILFENADEGSDTVQTQSSYTLEENFEHLVLIGNINAIGRGNSANNTLLGNSGENQLFGEDGNDWLDGKAGADTMTGGKGNDTYTVDSNFDVIIELANEGIDRLIVNNAATTGNPEYHMPSTIENLSVEGSVASLVYANELNNNIALNQSAEVHAGAGDDTIRINVPAGVTRGGSVFGDDGNDYISSYTPGADRVYGGNIYGGAGNDKIVVTTQSAVIYGEDGNDIIELKNAAGSTALGQVGNDTYVLDKDSFSYTGTYVVIQELKDEGVDTIQTELSLSIDVLDWNTYVRNTTGIMTVNSGGTPGLLEIENLTLLGTENLIGYGNALNNTLLGNTGNNLIQGRDGNDVLVGQGGSDTLDGGNGNDMLMVLPTLPTGVTINPTGSTQLTGGAGSDVFRMNLGYVGNHTAGANQLSITDFVRGQDKLSYFLDASSATPTSLNALTVGSGATLASLVDQAAASSASKAAPTLTAFAFSGNTYVVLDQSASTTFDSSSDLAIQLVGEPVLTLSDFSFAKAAAA